MTTKQTAEVTHGSHRVVPLSADIWPAFADLVRKHNGIFGGCWCTYFHPGEERQGDESEAFKKRLVHEGRAHAAVVFDGDQAIGWCEYGPPPELPNIYHRKAYEKSEVVPADFRLTCFFVDRDHRKRGVAQAALYGALDLIAAAGGGTVEGFPRHDLAEKKMSASFLYNGTLSMFEQAGFEKVVQLSAHRTLVRRTVAPA